MIFSNIKQSQREIALIIVAFSLLIILSISMKLYDAHRINQINEITNRIMEHPLIVSNAALDLQVEIAKFRNEMLHIVFLQNKETLVNHINNIHTYERSAYTNIQLIKKLILGEKGKILARKTEKLFLERKLLRDLIISYALKGETSQAIAVFKRYEVSYAELDRSAFQLNQYARGKVNLYQNESDDLFAEFEKINFYVSIALLLLFIFVTYYTVHRVSRYVRINEKLTESLKDKSDELEQILVKELKKEEALSEQAHIFDSLQDSIILHDLEGHFLYLNENAWKTRGYTKEEMMGMSVKELDAPESVNDDHVEMLKSAIEKMRDQGHIKFRIQHVCKNGDRLPVEIYAKIVAFHGQPCILSSVRDISQQVQAEEEIKKLSTVVEQIDDAVMMTDKNGVILYVNNAFCSHLGYRKEEIIGNTPRMFKSDHHNNDFYHDLWKTISEGKIYRNTLINKKKNGDIFYENKTITPLRDQNEEIIGFVSTGKDVTKEMLVHQEMERIATIDQLTGIYNRHKFEELLTLEIKRSRRFLQPLSLILMDIDHFKAVNDTYGHDIGDEVLKYLVKIIKENIRQIDIFTRWGGEEFLVLCPNTDLINVQILAEKLRLAIEGANFPKVSHITISQSVCMFENNETFNDLFKRVDQALYYAKEHGRNQVGVAPSKPLASSH